MSAENYQDVLDQLHAAGLCGRGVDDGLRIGSLVRVRVEDDREKRGWYSLHELTTGSATYLVGSFGVWHGNDNGARKIELRKTELSDDQRAALKKRVAEDRRRADAARRAESKRAAARAAAAWKKCEPSGESAYLQEKSVQGFGVRYAPSGALVIPVYDISLQIHGLQIIRGKALAKAKRKPAKEFWPRGMSKRGHFHLIGMPDSVVMVAEGYATAATVHQATGGLPVVVAFDAGNLRPVCEQLRKKYPRTKIVICADDDAFSKKNAGVEAASSAALAVEGSWIIPAWADDAARRARYEKQGHKRTDFNDLAADEGIASVTRQLQAHLGSIGWVSGAAATTKQGERGAGEKLRPVQSVDELVDRFSLVYGHGGAVFDHQEHRLLSLSDMRDICWQRWMHKHWMEHPSRDIVRPENVGFDPGDDDPEVTCNLWGGWPTTPQSGDCDLILDMLRHMCSGDTHPDELYQWVLRWIAYPIQHPGAKMKTTVVVHGPQGTGKNAFFECVMSIYGRYGRMIDQNALEDKFNDWASGKLFLLADEVVARSDVYHVKNKLKSFITGDWVRINPKNIAAYDERNHANIVFLSNESMPVVLEQDDRRHCVIWTPPKKDPEYYKRVFHQIRNGGIAALHDHLLSLDLGDFHTAIAPPETAARSELLTLSQDSTTRFWHALCEGDTMLKSLRPALSQDVYEMYKIWCARTGNKAAPMPRLQNALLRKHGVKTERKRYYSPSNGVLGPHSVCMMGVCAPEGSDEKTHIGESVRMFQAALDDYKGVPA